MCVLIYVCILCVCMLYQDLYVSHTFGKSWYANDFTLCVTPHILEWGNLAQNKRFFKYVLQRNLMSKNRNEYRSSLYRLLKDFIISTYMLMNFFINFEFTYLLISFFCKFMCLFYCILLYSTPSPIVLQLSAAVPVSEHLNLIIAGILKHIGNIESSFTTILPSIRTLALLCEHDFGFFHVKK